MHISSTVESSLHYVPTGSLLVSASEDPPIAQFGGCSRPGPSRSLADEKDSGGRLDEVYHNSDSRGRPGMWGLRASGAAYFCHNGFMIPPVKPRETLETLGSGRRTTGGGRCDRVAYTRGPTISANCDVSQPGSAPMRCHFGRPSMIREHVTWWYSEIPCQPSH